MAGEVPPAAHLQYLKPQLLAQALVHHKFVFTLPKRVRNDHEDPQVMVTKANSIKGGARRRPCGAARRS